MNGISERAQREKSHFNEGLQRKRYNSILSHTRYYDDEHLRQVRNKILACANGKTVLEIGSTEWFKWLDRERIFPSSIDCINISEKELQAGIDLTKSSKLVPRFHIMDAHDLQFGENQFDVVFGNAMLHHLDLPSALDEVCRVLKPDGLAVFREPLDINPVAKIVRWLTPRARTDDEQPFQRSAFREIEKRFATEYYFEQLLVVPAGVLSRFLFKRPDNFLTHAAFKMDRALLRSIPSSGFLYRVVMMTGRKKASGEVHPGPTDLGA